MFARLFLIAHVAPTTANRKRVLAMVSTVNGADRRPGTTKPCRPRRQHGDNQRTVQPTLDTDNVP